MKVRINGRHPLALSLLLAVLGLVSGACELSLVRTIPIGDLLKTPTEYMGKEVQVEGEVTHAAQVVFIESRVFKVRDETGEVLISTTRPVPAVGAKVRVRGVVATLATFGGMSEGVYLQETQRR